MSNILRSRTFMGLNRAMKSCTNILQLQQLKEAVLKYHKDKMLHSGELLANYMERESNLSPNHYEDEFDTMIHRRLESK